MQPLIVTLRCDGASEKILTALRSRFFPQSRNHLAAHVTLFHALPATSHDLFTHTLSKLASATPPFTLGIKDPFPLGKKGVGIRIASFKLRKLHEDLLGELRAEGVQLTEQDTRRLSPHVTVQNKVGEEEARRTLGILKEEFEERVGMAEALSLWRYEVGGQWTHLQDFPFSGT